MSTLADTASVTEHSGWVGRVRRARVAAGQHPHLALLAVVCGALATEPAVQAGRNAASTLAAALVVGSDREQLAVGLAIAGATFANALVHPYTVPVAWQLASAVMFALAIGLTAWLVLGATQPRATTEAPP